MFSLENWFFSNLINESSARSLSRQTTPSNQVLPRDDIQTFYQPGRVEKKKIRIEYSYSCLDNKYRLELENDRFKPTFSLVPTSINNTRFTPCCLRFINHNEEARREQSPASRPIFYPSFSNFTHSAKYTHPHCSTGFPFAMSVRPGHLLRVTLTPVKVPRGATCRPFSQIESEIVPYPILLNTIIKPTTITPPRKETRITIKNISLSKEMR